MRQILPALGLGALTTTLSYLALALTPLVGLQQIALFASCGIFVSFGTVVLWFPKFLHHPHSHAHRLPPLHHGVQWLLTRWHRHRKAVAMIYVLLTLICLTGFWSLRIDDSPRALNALPPELAAQDRRIRTIMGTPAHHSSLIVEGPTAEAALQKLESFHAILRAETTSPFVRLGPILSEFLPSLQQQKKDQLASRTLLLHRQQLETGLTQLGLPLDIVQPFFQTLQQDEHNQWLRPEDWLRHDASLGLRHLWLGQTMRGTALLVPILHVDDMAALRAAIDRLNGGIYYLNQVEDFTRVFKRYRHQAIQLAAGAYGLIFLLLLWRYRARAPRLILPPLLAALITVGLLGLLGQPFHVMHGLALLLILGMGVDYTIFIAESSSEARPATELALVLSAMTTLLSFGLLSLSRQAVLQSIGLTSLIGITVVLCLVPIARNGRIT